MLMTTTTDGATGVVIMNGGVIVMNGVVTVMDIEMGTGTVDMVDTNLDIRNPMAMRNLFTSRLQCTTHRSNRPALACFFH